MDFKAVNKYGLGFTRRELDMFDVITRWNKDEFTSDELAKKAHVDKSTAQRFCKKAYDLGLLQRGQTNMEGGGYEFRYKMHSNQVVIDRITPVVLRAANDAIEDFKR